MNKYTIEKIQQLNDLRSELDLAVKARIYAAQIHYELAEEATAPGNPLGFASHVTEEDKRLYAERERLYGDEVVGGRHDHNFTIWQRIYYFLTGEDVPLLK